MSMLQSSDFGSRPYWSLSAFAIAGLALIYFSYHFNHICLSIELDGWSYRTYLNYQSLDRAPFSQTGVDAGQGNFDAYYPLYHEYLLPHTLARFLFHTFPDKVTVYFVYGTAALFALYLLSRAVGLPPLTALAAGLLFDVFGLPGLVSRYSQYGSNFHTNPYWVQDGVACFLTIAAFWALGTRNLRNPMTWLLILVPSLCLIVAVVSTGAQVFFIVPATAVYSGAAFLDGPNWRSDAPRIIAAAFLIVVAVGTGLPMYYYTLVEYSAYNFFSSEFLNYPLSSTLVSTFFMTRIGQLTIILGIVGAIWVIATKSGRLRLFAAAHLLITSGQFVFGILVVFVFEHYHGSSPRYFEMFIWPVALIFNAYVAVAGGSWLLRAWLARYDGRGTAVYARAAEFVLFAMLAAAFLYNCANLVMHVPSQCNARQIQPTVITEYLAKAIALRPAERFRGIVATIDGVADKPSINWFDLHAHDGTLWSETGNDHRSVGLWRYSIPTLFQYFTFITPPYYLLLTDFLARREDKQLRSVLVLTKIDAKMMRLWGVRYVITDKTQDTGREVAQLPRLKNPPLRLIEFQDANLGNYSPVNVVHADSAHAELAAMHEPSFDPERTVMTDSPLEGALVPASAVELTYERYGFHISAKSDGRSLLILPVQYSRCWTVEGDGAPALFRANLMQLGVSFTGTLDAQLVFRFGPILAGGCRLEDLQDMYRLRISEARAAR